MIAFKLPITPPNSTFQGRRWTKTGHTYKAKEQVEAEHTYEALLAPHAPPAPLQGPLTVRVVFVRPYVKSVHLRNKSEMGRQDFVPSTAKPDCGNAMKALLDCMERMRFFEDDKQVASETTFKVHGPPERVGVYVALCALEPIDVKVVSAMLALIDAEMYEKRENETRP